MNKPIIIIAGPTASGKTEMAVDLAKKFNGEIINADSRTLYRKMNIATSKPSEDEKRGVPHQLFDIIDPDELFTVSDYKKLAEKQIEDIWKKGKVPFLVGGTGLYLEAVVYDFNLTEGKPNLELRKVLSKLSEKELFDKLKEIDPISAENIDPKNKRRLIRALEVTISTGKPFSAQKKKKRLPKNVLYLAIDVPRKKLYEKINKRIDSWLNTGLIEETQKLYELYSEDLPALTAIGYKEIIGFLKGNLEKEESIAIMKKRTRNYAKRQNTWFTRNKDITWVKTEKEAAGLIYDFLELA